MADLHQSQQPLPLGDNLRIFSRSTTSLKGPRTSTSSSSFRDGRLVSESLPLAYTDGFHSAQTFGLSEANAGSMPELKDVDHLANPLSGTGTIAAMSSRGRSNKKVSSSSLKLSYIPGGFAESDAELSPTKSTASSGDGEDPVREGTGPESTSPPAPDDTILNHGYNHDPSNVSFASDASSLHHSSSLFSGSEADTIRPRSRVIPSSLNAPSMSHKPSDDSLVWADASMDHDSVLPSVTDIPSSPPGSWDLGNHQDPPSNYDYATSLAANTSSLETMSSPSAAAAARTVTRAISMATLGGYETADDRSPERRPHLDGPSSGDEDTTPRKTKAGSSHGSLSVKVPTLRSKLTVMNLNDPHSPGGNDSISSDFNGSKRRRPGVLRERTPSQRSSRSSLTPSHRSENKDQVDLDSSADYALQTGGAQPAHQPLVGLTKELARSISLGSIASGVGSVADGDGSHERGRPRLGAHDSGTSAAALSPLFEESGLMQHEGDSTPQPLVIVTDQNGESTSIPATPAQDGIGFKPPSDTVLAERVNDVQVPMTVARRFQSMHRTPSTESRSTTASGKANRNHSLKEQTAIIEKLTKENFNLKLKINFLDEALNQRSDEGQRAMIAQNVEQKASMVLLMQENKAQRKEMRNLQKRLKEQEEAFAALKLEQDARKYSNREAGVDSDEEPSEGQLDYLRGKVRAYELEVENLRKDLSLRDAERHRLANLLKATGQRSLAEDQDYQEDEAALYKDMYHAEQGRLETASRQIQELQGEVARLKQDKMTLGAKARQESGGHSVIGSEMSRDLSDLRSVAGTTLVDQLRHENAELRREMGARSSLLTNRDREKERLQQELEEMKSNMIRGGGMRSLNGDSILDRSASRAFHRPGSRASANTYNTALSDAERDEYEQKNGYLRDCISGLRMEKQDLQQQLVMEAQERESLDQRFVEMEQDMVALGRQFDEAQADLLEKEQQLQDWEEDAKTRGFETQDGIAQRDRAINDLEQQLRDAEEVKEGHSLEYQKLSNQLHASEIQQQSAVQRLRQELNELNVENESLLSAKRSLEQYRSEIDSHNRQLNTQVDGLQNRHQYMQEDQDRNKVKISELEAAITNYENNSQAERARVRQLEQDLMDERLERQRSSTQDKQQAVHEINNLRNSLDGERNECLKLKTLLSTREMEVNHYRFRLEDLEGSLRESLGETGNSKTSLIRSVEKLQVELDTALNQLEMVRGSLAEREQQNRQLELRYDEARQRHQQLSQNYEQERSGHKNLGRLHEQLARRTEKHNEEVAIFKAEVSQLEAAQREEAREKERLEAYYSDALGERNNILLALWNRLSILCGQEWIQQNGSVNGRRVSPDVVASMFPAFSSAVIAAVKGVELLCGSFKQRIRQVEKDLWRDYSSMQHELLLRTTRMDKLEHSYRNQRNEVPRSEEASRLKSENKLLKGEIANIRKSLPSRPRTGASLRHVSETVASVAANGFGASPSRSRFSVASAIQRAPSTSHGSPMISPTSEEEPANGQPEASRPDTGVRESFATGSDESDQRWILRLKELERRLKAEREARLIDRSGARRRLEEGQARQNELKQELEREKERNGRLRRGSLDGGLVEVQPPQVPVHGSAPDAPAFAEG